MLLYLALVAPVTAQEWTRFRGPNGSGISSATTVPTEWTEDDYNWRVALPGVGHSSPVLWGKRLFVTSGTEKTGTRIALCVDATNGETLWTREFAAAVSRKHGLNSFASGTPAVDRDHVYVSWATPEEYIVLALEHAGREVWRRDLGGYNTSYGFGSSPIVVGDLVIVTHEHDGDSSVVALDGKSGAVRWKVPRRSKVTFSTPCLFRRGLAEELILVSWTHGVTAVDPVTGRTNWEIDLFNKGHVETSIGSTVVSDELVFGCSGWLGVRMEVVAVRPPQASRSSSPDDRPVDNAPAPMEAYRIDRAAPLVTTPLVRDDLLFLWSDDGIVTCIDARSGEVHWRQRVGGTYYGSPVCVGDRLYCMSREGEAVVLAASKQYEPLARNPLGAGSHSTPAVAGGVMYLRTFSHLISIGGQKSEPRASASAEQRPFAALSPR